ncbi:PEP-CTERM sorting domain-containing protein [Planctomycetales bacterium ZRK34]|nr:PEP-CTERM sorting domain-containing protein [Planctomycetales bacterium ZRK34]
MRLNEMRQNLRNITLGAALTSVLVAAPAMAASTVADFDTAGTAYSLREWNSAGDNPPVIMNDAAHTEIGDYLQLIPEVGNERNTVAFDRTALGLYQTITVDYDFRITNTTGTPADGLGMSLLSTANYGTTGDGANFAQHSAPAKSLNIGIDDYNNNYGPTETNNNHVEIGYNGQPDRAVSGPLSFNLTSGDWHHAQATFEYTTNGTAVTLVITPDAYGTPGAPVTVFNRAVIAGALPYEARIAFGSGTGGSDATHDIDNVNAVFDTNGKGFNFAPDFSAASASQFEFVNTGAGSTGLVTSGSTFLQVTSNDLSQGGSAWLKEKQSVKHGFVTEFDFEFPNISPDGFNGSLGADGMSFMIQDNGLTGYNPGRAGATGSVAIELDSFSNSEPSAALLAIRKDGTRLVTVNLDATSLNIDNLSDSGVHSVRVEYVDGLMDVYFDGLLLINDQAVDLSDVADASGEAYVGFVANTGGEGEEHNVLNWSFASAVSVPEPSTFALLGLAGLGLIRRRRDLA